MVSLLTILQLNDTTARYASYGDFAEVIRHRFTSPAETLKEVFSRLVFNVLCGNTDDHARNHAAFWDGKQLSLTPAYDICPQGRTGNEASQAMKIVDQESLSQLKTCIKAAENFQLTKNEANAIIDRLIAVIQENWETVCDSTELSQIDRQLLWGRQFLNDFSLER